MSALYHAQCLARALRECNAPEFAQRRARKLVAKFTRMTIRHALG